MPHAEQSALHESSNRLRIMPYEHIIEDPLLADVRTRWYRLRDGEGDGVVGFAREDVASRSAFEHWRILENLPNDN